ncbi:MAG: hypothetical protein HY332_18770 [Chloroflexi bacterium]|nr:hypothetical protein [Chloroflexota bacterium]
MAAVPKTDAGAHGSQSPRRKLPFHALRGLTLTQEEADQLDPSLTRRQDNDADAVRPAPDREAARAR